MKIKIYCTSVKYRKILDKMPENIIPLGVGMNSFPKHWLNENSGDNISNLNIHYGEHSGIYWVWKNCMDQFTDKDWIGFCHYRKYWLNDEYHKKQKFNFGSLYEKFLKSNNHIFKNNDVILVQPIIYKKKQNLFEDFKDVHRTDILNYSLNFLNHDIKREFQEHLSGNLLYPLNMFITKKTFFIKYCENVFPWLEKCMNYSKKKKLLTGYNIRLPSFLSERFVSSWFSNFKKKKTLSYARLGNFFLSDYSNILFNSTRLPMTFSMYPTLHDY